MTAGRKYRGAVIGSGFGGIAAAIRLQAAGVNTVLFESRDQPGGRAGVFRDKGYTFDTGPTVITAPETFEELFAFSGRPMAEHIELIPIHPFYRLLWENGDKLDYGVDTDRMMEQIRRWEPRDCAGYESFLDFSRRNYEAGYTELVSTAFLRPWDMVKVSPKLALLRSDRPVYQTVSKFVRDERLRQALSFHTLLIGGSPFETSSIYTLIHYLERTGGVYFPRGGTSALVAAMVSVFRELGGELRLSSPVRSIDVIDSRGRTEHQITSDGSSRERFDFTVSNADLHHTYGTLLGHHRSARKMRRRLERMRWSMSLFVLYFGTDCQYPDLAHHTIIFGKRFEGLIHDIFHGAVLPDDFSLYLHAPTVTDPSLAPEGGSSFYVLSPVPHLGNAAIDWTREGPAYADRILAYLEQFLPDLRKHIVSQSFFSPLDFRDQLGAYLGNGFSVAPLLTQSAWFRPHNRDAHLPGLYIVGAGTHPGAGVPGVISSAKATVRVILEDFGLAGSR